MSLINEALRKARQAASEHDSKQSEGPFQPAKAYPSRRRERSGGLLVTALIAIFASVVGAAAAWWILGNHETASTNATKIESPSPEAATTPATPQESPTPVEDQAKPVVLPVPTEPAETPVVESAPEQDQIEIDPPVVASEERPTILEGEREFVMEADLGYATLNLGYIVARSSNPFAEINDTEVWIGSEIEGFVVEAIEANRVILRDDKGPLSLRVP